MLADWIILYDDGSSYSDLDGPADQAPETGVEYIAMRDDPLSAASAGYHLISKTDHYVYTGRRWNWWIGVDDVGKLDYEFHRREFFKRGLIDGPRPLFLTGRYISDMDFGELRRRFEEFEKRGLLPLKSAYRADEPR